MRWRRVKHTERIRRFLRPKFWLLCLRRLLQGVSVLSLQRFHRRFQLCLLRTDRCLQSRGMLLQCRRNRCSQSLGRCSRSSRSILRCLFLSRLRPLLPSSRRRIISLLLQLFFLGPHSHLYKRLRIKLNRIHRLLLLQSRRQSSRMLVLQSLRMRSHRRNVLRLTRLRGRLHLSHRLLAALRRRRLQRRHRSRVCRLLLLQSRRNR